MGNPIKLVRAAREASNGVGKYGAGVESIFGVSRARQWLAIVLEHLKLGTTMEEFYWYRFYLPEHRQTRSRQFPYRSSMMFAQIFLTERQTTTDDVDDKRVFATICKRLELPGIPIVAEFANGKLLTPIDQIPPQDLFSKRVDQYSGGDTKRWRHDQGFFTDFASGARMRSRQWSIASANNARPRASASFYSRP